MPIKNGIYVWFSRVVRRKNGIFVKNKIRGMIEYKVIVSEGGSKFWHLNGQLHKEDGPAVEWANGDKEWYLNGKFHREGKPAIEHANGDKYWYLNGKLHREDGPAVEYVSGDKYWHLNGKLHRKDGPAIEKVNGYKSWYLNGEKLTEEEFNQRTKTCEGKEVEIDGKVYVLKLK